MNDPIITGLFTLGGVAVGAFVTFFVAYLNRRFEDRRHFRELGLKVAMAKFEQQTVLAQKLADATKEVVKMVPFDAFVVYGIKLMEVVSDTSLSADEMAKRISGLSDFSKAAVRHQQTK